MNANQSQKVHSYDQLVYLLQGGGALGAYQVGVCEVLLDQGFHPDWVIGTSIGAINSALIAGNPPQHRIAHLHGFWNEISLPLPELKESEPHYWLRKGQKLFSANWTMAFGLEHFFSPRPFNPWFDVVSAPDQLSFYDTSMLRASLEKFIDFDLLNQRKVRLTLGAVSLKDGEQVEFDNYKQTIGPEHIMASCALPPGFPAIEIDGAYYWDGGVISNTPLSIILREKVPQKLLCIMVNLFSHSAELPRTMMDVLKRKKDLGLTSRHHEILYYLCQLHQYQHLIYQLNQKMQHNVQVHDEVCQTIKKMAELGHPTACNIIRFHYHDDPSDSWCKDFEFSKQSQQEHRKVGYLDAMCAMQQRDWVELIPDDAGVVIHDFRNGQRLSKQF